MGRIDGFTRAVREKFIVMTHSNEKHVDDFTSESDFSIIEEKGAAPKQKGKAVAAKEENMAGVDPIVKTFYESEDSIEGQYNWCEVPPRQLSKKAALKHDRVAIRVYKVKDISQPIMSGRFALKYHQVDLQNPALISALKDIVKKEGVYLDPSEIAKFCEPFRPLYFCAEEIATLYKDTAETSPLKTQLLLLLKLMGDMFGATRTQVRQLQANNLMSYKLAWTYFPKDSLAYRPGKDCETVYKVVNTTYKSKPCPHLSVDAKEIVFDGTAFAWVKTDFQLPAWSGNKPITDLNVYPLEFHADPEGIKSRLIARGEKALDYQGLNYCLYTGVGYHFQGKKLEKVNVDGRILLDNYGYNKYHDQLTRQGGKEANEDYQRIGDEEDESSNKLISKARANGVVFANPNQPKVKSGEDTDASYAKRLTAADIERNKTIMMKRPNDLLFLSPLLKGYCLKNKLWLNFYVDDVRPMIYNDAAFDHLVYPPEQKDLVYSFVEHHQRTRASGSEMDDVIKGKGQGLVFLLSGPPGTGKTLTAEATADKCRRPLFYLQAEDLGTNPSLLGANLKKMFEMATDWQAVMLLDECDVFLAERNPVDITRNELVSIFLREIEYFRGVLFLTTNLYDAIDAAFRSRMSIHLRFNPLAPDARRQVWRKFIERLPPMNYLPGVVPEAAATAAAAEEAEDESGTAVAELKPIRAIDMLDDADFAELSLWELNGREIKNAIKTVKSWCDCKGYVITLSRLESGIKVTAPSASKRGVADTSLYDE
jgi:hypothetical protein